jgi:amino-acid N-acetyltransferase
LNPQESASSIPGNDPHSKYGFRTVEDKSELPDKIFKDCQNCPRLHRCDQVAMVRGRIPRMSILGPREEAQQLVRISG